MQNLLKEYTTPDGCVTFVMHSRTTIDVEIERDQLDHDLPDYSNAGKGIQNIAFAYKLCLAHTNEIRFNNVDEKNEWCEFKQWWESRKNATNPQHWDGFRKTFERDKIDTWADAYQMTRAKKVVAPETLHPGAEERAANAPDFLSGDNEISENGGDSSEKSLLKNLHMKQKSSELEMAVQNAS